VVEGETLMEMKAQKKPARKEVAGTSTPEKQQASILVPRTLCPRGSPANQEIPKGALRAAAIS
jgi:hypothetical protein